MIFLIDVSRGYIPQSEDTTIEAELVQFALWRKMTVGEKLNLVKRVVQRGNQLALMGIEHHFPNASPAEVKHLYIQKRWGGIECNFSIQGDLMLEDPIWLAYKIASILESLSIAYYIGGSVASSLQGEVRFTEDLDLVINIIPSQIGGLISAFKDEFYISEVAIDEAVRGLTSSFNVIHLQTTEKADIFISRDDAFSVSKLSRRQLYIPEGKEEQAFYVSTPEDTILQKLLWFKMTGNRSQKQWRDILGVLKLQRYKLYFDYLSYWGERLEVLESLQQALIQAGL